MTTEIVLSEARVFMFILISVTNVPAARVGVWWADGAWTATSVKRYNTCAREGSAGTLMEGTL